jgi:hypothetical protein
MSDRVLKSEAQTLRSLDKSRECFLEVYIDNCCKVIIVYNEWAGASCEWDRYELFLIFLVICEGASHKLWMRWEWTLRDNNLSSCPTKNSSKMFDHKWGQVGNTVVNAIFMCLFFSFYLVIWTLACLCLSF